MRPFIQFSSRNIQKSKEYYLAFNLDEDCFGANFPKIAGFSKEFVFEEYSGNVPFIAGLAQINNEFIPVIDLKYKMGMNHASCKNTGKVVVVEAEIYSNTIKFAIFYNSLGDAFEIPDKKMMPVPEMGKYFESGCVKGVHLHENNCIMILDFERIFSVDDLIDIMVVYGSKIKCKKASEIL
jgi:purine-binding chemotaxis protein CheW